MNGRTDDWLDRRRVVSTENGKVVVKTEINKEKYGRMKETSKGRKKNVK